MFMFCNIFVWRHTKSTPVLLLTLTFSQLHATRSLRFFEAEDVQELYESLKMHGYMGLYPMVVEKEQGGDTFSILEGNHRYVGPVAWLFVVEHCVRCFTGRWSS